MTDTGSEGANRYILVSSLYGPGTVVCWCLTVASVLISWTIHPRKRVSGSVDVDLVAVLVLPTISAGHVISQMLRLRHDLDTAAFHKLDNDFLERLAAIEAPFALVEIFMSIAVVLVLLGLWNFCLRRACLVAIVGLCCFGTECHIHFSRLNTSKARLIDSILQLDGKNIFSRAFVADFASLIITVTTIVGVCIILAFAVSAYMLWRWMLKARARRNERRDGLEEGSAEWIQALQRDLAVRSSSSVSMILLPITCVLNAVPIALDALIDRRSLEATLSSRVERFLTHFFPCSSNSLLDLDQAVTMAAGATVLAFSAYSAASALHIRARPIQQSIMPTGHSLFALRHTNRAQADP